MRTAPVSPFRPSTVGDDVLAALTSLLGARDAAFLLLDPTGMRRRAVAALGAAAQAGADDWAVIDATERHYWRRIGCSPDAAYVTAGAAPAAWEWIGPAAGHVAVPIRDASHALRGVLVVAAAAPVPGVLAAATALGRVAARAVEHADAADLRDVELAHHRTLLDIVREVDRPVELPQVLAAICRKTVEGFGCRQATVFFQSRRHRASLPLADYGTPPHVAARFVGERYIHGNIPHEQDVAAGRTVVIDRAAATPEDHALLDQVEVPLMVQVPLRDDTAAVRGVLNLGFAESRPLGDVELRAIEMVGRHASMAIVRARLLHGTVEAAQFRAAVSALAIELNAATSRAQALQTLCRRGAELFGVSAAAVFLDAGGALVAEAAVGELAGPTSAIALAAADAPVVRAFAAAELVLEKDRPRRDDGPVLDRLRSLLAIPLVEAEGPVGVLVLGALRPRRFRPNVVQEAPLLGTLAAAVLRNVALMGQLQESNQRLHRLSASKDQFLANVSHDLRTPLNIIIGYGQLAVEETFGTPPDALREILGRIVQSARQQLTLVQDLLDVSRLEFNALSVKAAPLAIATLFADLEFLAESLVRDKPVRVIVEPPSEELWAQADADRTRQILTNLLGNAAKFTDEGTISVRADATADGVRVRVADTGVGIPADQLDAIFEPFRQVEGERARLGTGLGLAIAHRLAALMQGALTVESTLGRGSTFTLTLPSALSADRVATVVNS